MSVEEVFSQQPDRFLAVLPTTDLAASQFGMRTLSSRDVYLELPSFSGSWDPVAALIFARTFGLVF